MKQIVDKLNKIAKKINENVELSDRDLIIDSLDSITKAYGGTPNDSNLIVDKLDDIYNNIAPAVSGNIEITENGENINVAPYATATVNVSGGGDIGVKKCTVTIANSAESTLDLVFADSAIPVWLGGTAVIRDQGLFYEAGDFLTVKEIVITPGNSLTLDCYYTEVSNDKYFAVGIADHASYSGVFSNINNMERETIENTTCYAVTDFTEDSSCTLTVTHTL